MNKLSVALFSLILVAVLLFPLNPVLVDALSPEQKKLFDSGIYYFDAEVSSETACAAILPGNDNEEKIWNYLVGTMGFTAIQAAGIMGNIQRESGFSTTALNSDSGAYGIIQWYAGRKTGLQNYAAEQGKDVSDLGVQLGYMKIELEQSYAQSVLEPLKAATTLEEATLIWLERYEVPCTPGSAECQDEMDIRLPAAVDWLAKFGSTTPTTTGSVGCDSGSVVGGYGFPLDRVLYDQNPGNFTRPHHSNRVAVDIPVPEGREVYSILAGKIISAPPGGDCGNGVIIDSEGGIRITYCHGIDGGSISGAGVNDSVVAGQLIMHSGNTGHSTGPHLHIQIDINGSRKCPQPLLVGIAEGSPPDIFSLPTSGCTYSRGVQ